MYAHNKNVFAQGKEGKTNERFTQKAMKEPRCACGRKVVPPKRKCAKCMSTKRYKVVEMRASRAGSNKIGYCAHKPDKAYTRKAKRQNTGKLGLVPQLAKTNWGGMK